MYGLQLLILTCFANYCVGMSSIYFKYVTGSRGNTSGVFQGVPSVSTYIECGRHCQKAVGCLSASFCGGDCHLSNETTNNVFDGLPSADCTYMELTAECSETAGATNCVAKVTCPADYRQYGKLCIKYFEAKMPYSEANTTCVMRGGHLLSLHAGDESILPLLASNCEESDCKHIWVDGRMYVNWNGEPFTFNVWDNNPMKMDECPMLCTDKDVLKASGCDKDREVYCQIDIN